jgi:hypothetical protein
MERPGVCSGSGMTVEGLVGARQLVLDCVAQMHCTPGLSVTLPVGVVFVWLVPLVLL